MFPPERSSLPLFERGIPCARRTRVQSSVFCPFWCPDAIPWVCARWIWTRTCTWRRFSNHQTSQSLWRCPLVPAVPEAMAWSPLCLWKAFFSTEVLDFRTQQCCFLFLWVSHHLLWRARQVCGWEPDSLSLQFPPWLEPVGMSVAGSLWQVRWEWKWKGEIERRVERRGRMRNLSQMMNVLKML